MMKFKRTLLTGILAVSGLPAAYAGLISTSATTPSLTTQVGVSSMNANSMNSTSSMTKMFDLTKLGRSVDMGAGTFAFMGMDSNSIWDFSWNISANADPFITGNLTFTNTTRSDQTFNVVLALPTLTTSGSVLETGELGFTLSDTGMDGTANLALNQWHGLINPLTSAQQDMSLLTGTIFNCSGGPGCVSILSPLSNSQSHSDIDHGGAITSIGTHLNFTLSAGDTLNINTKWDVTPVPVPAALWLFMSGFAGLAGVVKLRKKQSVVAA
ncbi:MAG: VPLPA-CTERM sorting domain-containing protein [Pseudomonadota bacterium]